MMSNGYKKTNRNHCVYAKKFGNDDFIFPLLYIDDTLLVGKILKKFSS